MVSTLTRLFLSDICNTASQFIKRKPRRASLFIVSIIVMATGLTTLELIYIDPFPMGKTIPAITGIFTAGLLLLLLLGTGIIVRMMGTDQDRRFIGHLPISKNAIITSRYIVVFLLVGLPIWLIESYPLIILGLRARYDVLYYPITLIACFLLTAFVLSVSLLISLLLMNIASRLQSNLFLIFCGLAGFVLFGYVFTAGVAAQNLDMLTVEPMIEFPDWFPVKWATDALTLSGSGSQIAWIPILLLVLAASLSITLAVYINAKCFFRKPDVTGGRIYKS